MTFRCLLLLLLSLLLIGHLESEEWKVVHCQQCVDGALLNTTQDVDQWKEYFRDLSARYLYLSLDWVPAECKVAEIKINISESEGQGGDPAPSGGVQILWGLVLE